MTIKTMTNLYYLLKAKGHDAWKASDVSLNGSEIAALHSAGVIQRAEIVKAHTVEMPCPLCGKPDRQTVAVRESGWKVCDDVSLSTLKRIDYDTAMAIANIVRIAQTYR